MRDVAIVGAGMIPFGEKFDLSVKDMYPMAVSEAVASVDKGFDRRDVNAVWVSVNVPIDGFPAGIVADTCGFLDVPGMRAVRTGIEQGKRTSADSL